jgi:hypothetical protein
MSGPGKRIPTALIARVLSGSSATLPESLLPQSLNGRSAHDSNRSSRHMPSDDGQILRNLRSRSMTAADFRRIALSLGAGGRVLPRRIAGFSCRRQEICFAGLASRGHGNLMLTLQQQATFVEEAPEIFLADSWRLVKDGTHAYSPGGGERGCTDGCTPNGVETAN